MNEDQDRISKLEQEVADLKAQILQKATDDKKREDATLAKDYAMERRLDELSQRIERGGI